MKEVVDSVRMTREFFESGKTRDVKWRRKVLIRLRNALKDNVELLQAALKEDLGKSPEEAYMTEIGTILFNLNLLIRHIRKYAAVRRTRSVMALFPSRGYIVPEPYGTVLVISPWNYPLLLCVDPVAEAVAAGNTVVLKPSKTAPATSEAIARIFAQVFEPGHVTVVRGGEGVGDVLLEQHFDYIFYTGSERIGKLVMSKAAEHLTPVTLELGGKSPVIIDESADVDIAAKRVVFGKMMNSGQTCIAPDYVLIHNSLKDEFVEGFKKYSKLFLGENPLGNEVYPKMVNGRHFDRVRSYLEQGKVLCGGRSDTQLRKIEPTLLEVSDMNVPVMQEEIFGPVLPLVEYKKLEEALSFIRKRNSPLALYVFAENKKVTRHIIDTVRYGGGCVNDTLMHIVSPYMPFGGVGASGMGAYHGRYGFDTFTHYKSVLKSPARFDNPLRYPPFTARKFGIIKRFLG